MLQDLTNRLIECCGNVVLYWFAYCEIKAVNALSARHVDLKTSVVGCGGSAFFCLVWIWRWCRWYVGSAMISNRYRRCVSEVLCTVEGHKGCEQDSGGWVWILRICS